MPIPPIPIPAPGEYGTPIPGIGAPISPIPPIIPGWIIIGFIIGGPVIGGREPISGGGRGMVMGPGGGNGGLW